ncbi:hypothetical protein MYAM1_000414 [Malassezia yamatoensis]|uniref:Pre-rRNA-processing protein RIX1 N-terminal domain-containing protein n=1 Tax=Malassezia yamatoensis TaxID=253288 RepID=A0AAJ5YP93_9BASI|nr:hypothetical protein MYAM1_000414 [Malassezia yamatoensis]
MASFGSVLDALEERCSLREAQRRLFEAEADYALASLDETEHKKLQRRLQALITISARAQNSGQAWVKASEAISLYYAQAGWTVAEDLGELWIQQLLLHGEYALSQRQISPALLPVLKVSMDRMAGQEARAHPEYYRVVVSPNLPKVASLVVSLMELCEIRDPFFITLLTQTTSHIQQHPSLYRPHVSRIHSVCIRALFQPYTSESEAHLVNISDGLNKAAAGLLSVLHLTGTPTASHGKVSQAQLWLAPVLEMIDAATIAANGTVPSLPQSISSAALGWRLENPDYTVRIAVSLSRLQCILGDELHRGVLAYYLTTSTPKHVPVPLARLFGLARCLIRIQSGKQSNVPLDQLESESLALPRVRRAGLRLFALITTLFQQACWPLILEDPSILDDICSMGETSYALSLDRLLAIRCLAVCLTRGEVIEQHIGGAGLVLDPASTLVQRISRVAVQACSELIVTDERNEGHIPKRTRFESDSIAISSRGVQSRILTKESRAVQLAEAGVALFRAVFDVLAGSAMPGSRDIIRTGVLVILGISEALVDGRLLDSKRCGLLSLASTALKMLSALVLHNSGALMAYVLLRIRLLLQRGSLSTVPILRSICLDSLANTLPLLRPRAPPLFDSVDSSALEAKESDVVPIPQPGYHIDQRGASAMCEAQLLVNGEEAEPQKSYPALSQETDQINSNSALVNETTDQRIGTRQSQQRSDFRSLPVDSATQIAPVSYSGSQPISGGGDGAANEFKANQTLRHTQEAEHQIDLEQASQPEATPNTTTAAKHNDSSRSEPQKSKNDIADDRRQATIPNSGLDFSSYPDADSDSDSMPELELGSDD